MAARYVVGTTLTTCSTAMPTCSLATFALVVSSFRRHFTAPTFVRFLLLVAGWILAGEPVRCVTEALVAAGVSGQLHWQAFHCFFSRARWGGDALGKTLLTLLGPLLPQGLLVWHRREAEQGERLAAKASEVLGLTPAPN